MDGERGPREVSSIKSSSSLVAITHMGRAFVRSSQQVTILIQ